MAFLGMLCNLCDKFSGSTANTQNIFQYQTCNMCSPQRALHQPLKIGLHTVESESTQNPSLLPHFVTLQPYSKKLIKLLYFLLKNRFLEMFANVLKMLFITFTYVFRPFTQYFVEAPFWQRLQTQVFLAMTLQAWHICI